MPEFDEPTRNLLGGMLLMAGLLVLVAIGIQVITAYRRNLGRRSGSSGEDLAGSFREAFEAGEMSAEEYRQVCEAMGRGPAPAAPRDATSPAVGPPPEPPESADAGAPGDAGAPAPTDAGGGDRPAAS